MALAAVVDSLDTVDAQYHGLYTQRNGKFELTVEIPGVEGIKSFTDFQKLHGALVKERDDHKTLKGRFAVLGDRDPAEVLSILDRVPELEAAAAGKVDEAKLAELVEGRIKGKLAPIEREKGALATRVQELEAIVTQYSTKEKTRTIHDNVREALSKANGFVGTATEDALLYAERMLEIDESGKVVTKDNVGVTPGIDASVWLTEMQTKKPHWWGDSKGGGSLGGRTTTGGGANPWTAEHWNLTEQGRIYTENASRAEQLAKSAGTTVGGNKPAPRK